MCLRLERKAQGPSEEDLAVLRTPFPEVEVSLRLCPKQARTIRQDFNKDSLLPEFHMDLNVNSVYGDVSDVAEVSRLEAAARFESIAEELFAWKDPFGTM